MSKDKSTRTNPASIKLQVRVKMGKYQLVTQRLKELGMNHSTYIRHLIEQDTKSVQI